MDVAEDDDMGGYRLRVLVVEDDDDTRAMVDSMLQSLGVEVVHARDGVLVAEVGQWRHLVGGRTGPLRPGVRRLRGYRHKAVEREEA